jgi:hypothetical protein
MCNRHLVLKFKGDIWVNSTEIFQAKAWDERVSERCLKLALVAGHGGALSVIPVLGRLRQEDQELEGSLGSMVRPCLTSSPNQKIIMEI